MKKLTVIIAALALCALLPVFAMAEATQEGMTEVRASVAVDPGDVTYVLIIPDVVDFGALAQPAADVDSFKDVTFTVAAEAIDGLDPDTQSVAVCVMDQNVTKDDWGFYLVNRSKAGVKLSYDVYRGEPNSGNLLNTMFGLGFFLTEFTTQGEVLEGTLRLNQRQLYGLDLADIVGEYSGYLVFSSFVKNN